MELRFSYGPAFVASAIQHGGFTGLRRRNGHNNGISMRCQITEHFDCHLRKPSAFGQPSLSHGQRSRKRTRTSLRMTNDNGQENDENSYDKGRRKNIGRRRAAKLSVWENMVDKILLADDPSVDSEFPFPILLSLLAVATVASPPAHSPCGGLWKVAGRC